MNVWNPGAVLDIINSHYQIKTEKDICMFTEMIIDMDIDMIMIIWYYSSYRYELYVDICICIWHVNCGFSSLSGVSYNSPNFSRFVGIVLASFAVIFCQQCWSRSGRAETLAYLSNFRALACRSHGVELIQSLTYIFGLDS